VRYPSPLVRLALLAEVADKLGIDGRVGLHGIDARMLAPGPGQGNGIVAEDLRLVPKVATAVVGHSLADIGSFQQLYAWQAQDFLAGGRVEGWARALRTPALLFPEQSLRAARLLIAGAVAAWAEVALIPDRAERADATVALRETLLPVLAKSREEGTRAAAPGALPDTEELGEELAGLLLQKVPDRPIPT
jgi:hypothetical protein